MIAQAIMGTQAMKGVEIGLGFESGGSAPDITFTMKLPHDGNTFKRSTNRSGGIEGGMSTGMPIIVRGVMKPIPTMLNPLSTVDMHTLKETENPLRTL
ncbi:MAG: hypothetical protein BalsKO_31070 [Balneolaceae bacterium]